ncbi:MAG: hypothetical protein ACRD4J_00435, partial [Nitrososphaeraceae archaeon]
MTSRVHGISLFLPAATHKVWMVSIEAGTKKHKLTSKSLFATRYARRTIRWESKHYMCSSR